MIARQFGCCVYKRQVVVLVFFFQAEDGIRDFCLSRGLGDVYKRQVEDDANLCYIIRGGLEDMIGGYEVMTASNGEEGLKIWKEQHLDIIISDIEMPVMDGYEMVRRIRETDGFIPIVFTSGRVSPKDVVKGYELGVNNYIKKPFLAEELDAHIGALLKMKQGMGAANESEVYQIGENYTFDAVHAVLKCSSCVQKTMTEREAKLLQMLCKKKNELVRRDIILSRLWDTEDDFFASRSLDVFVTRLRKLFADDERIQIKTCLLYTSPSPRDRQKSRMPSSA